VGLAHSNGLDFYCRGRRLTTPRTARYRSQLAHAHDEAQAGAEPSHLFRDQPAMFTGQ
jgi:hypothetical protein